MAEYRASDLTIKLGQTGHTTNIGQVMSLGTVGTTRGLIDGSTYNADMKKWLLDQEDGDVLQIDVAYDPESAGIGFVQNAYNTRAEKTFHFAHEDADFECFFSALVTGFNRGGALAGVFGASFSLKITSTVEEETTSASYGVADTEGESS